MLSRFFLLIQIAAMSLGFSACASVGAQSRQPFAQVDSFLFQLQNIDLVAIGLSDYDLAVIDYSKDGTVEGEWSRGQIEWLKRSGKGKYVLAYISIGEAESYRFYWNSRWKTGDPDWLGRENPDWKENFKVKYWDPAWQRIVISYLDRIIDQGFDGIYMDIVDGCWYWGTDASRMGESEQLADAGEAANRMIEFVMALANHSRNVRGRQDFILCPQNGTEIIRKADLESVDAYLDAIDAVGVEDTFFFGRRAENNRYMPQERVIANLEEFVARDKKVLALEYLKTSNRKSIEQFYTLCEEYGYIPFAAGRALDELR